MMDIPWLSIEASAQALLEGHVIAYPTEGVYGIGCICDDTPIQMIATMKSRPSGQGLIVVSGSIDHFLPWIDADISALPDSSNIPTTWIVPANANAPQALLGPEQTLAIRISQHPVIQALTEAVDQPIVSTSANRRNEETAMSAGEVMAVFPKEIFGVTTGDLGGHPTPSRIMTLDGTRLR